MFWQFAAEMGAKTQSNYFCFISTYCLTWHIGSNYGSDAKNSPIIIIDCHAVKMSCHLSHA